MADDLKNILNQGPADQKSLTPFLLIFLLVVVGVAAIVFSRPWWEKHVKRTVHPQTPPPPEQTSQNPQQRSFQAICALASNSLEEARQKGYVLLAQTTDPALTTSLETLLGQLNIELILSPAAMPEKEEYVVQPGDSLERIARKFKTTIDLIKQSNALQQRPVLHPGDRLRVFKGTFTLTISKNRNDLVVKVNDRFFKRYRVGTGKFGTTPIGTFIVSDKIEQPPWWRPDGKMIPFGDKENVLGTRWMSIQATGATAAVRGYGLHGTWEPETIGKQASAGCIRLKNNEVEELFLLIPTGTSVTIAE